MPLTDSRRYFGPYTLIEDESSCFRDGEDINLFPQEFALLKCFLDNNGEWLNKATLFSVLWPYENPEVELDNRIQVLVSNLGKKLGSPGKAYIKSKRKRGYRFNAEVEYSKTISDEDCPWPGLRFVGEERAKHFYGREQDIFQMSQKLAHHNFLVVTSSSGIGKSSLVRAGLVPSLKGQAEAAGESLVSAIFTPTEQPLRQLAEQLLKLAHVQVTDAAIDQRIQSLSSDARDLKTALQAVETDRVLLVVDQFEELSLCEDKTEREVFVDNLMTAVADLPNKLRVVLTLRIDLYSRFQAYPALWSQLSNQHNLPKLLRDQLREVIEKPAESIGLSLDEGLADQILNDLGDEPTALPLLSHTMVELFKRRKGTRLTSQSYNSFGGVGEAIGTHAEEVYRRFLKTEQTVMRAIMIDLIQVGDRSDHDVRRPKPLRELVGQDIDAEQRAQIIQVLCDERLLFKGELPDESVEICHEQIIHHWRTLERWLNEGRDALRRFDRLRTDADDWNHSRRDSSLLYQGAKLNDAQIAITRYAEFMQPKAGTEFVKSAEWDFIEASVALDRSRHKRRRRLKIIGWVAAGIFVLVLGLLAGEFFRRRELALQRDRSESRRLAAIATSQLSSDPELSLALAIEAGKIASTEETDIALRRALMAVDQRSVYVGHRTQVISVCVSPDGKRLLSAGADHDARIWDIADRTTVKILSGHTDWVNWAAYNHDGTRIITAGREGQIRIWNANTGETLKTIPGHNGSVQNAAFSSDGARILSAGEDGTVRLWDVATGKELVPTMKGHGDSWVNTAVFSPDEKFIASAGGDGMVGIWDAATGRNLKTFRAHQVTVVGVAFDKEGRSLLTAGSDKVAKIWDTTTWELKTQFLGHKGPVFTAEFSPDGKWILTASKDGTARVWDAQSGLELKAFRGHRSAINGAVFSPDGNFAFTASGDSTIRMWAIQFGQHVGSLSGHLDVVAKTTFSRDGKWIATASHDKTARVWEASTRREIKSFLHPDAVEDVAFSPDARFIATAADDGKARICDVSLVACRELIRGSVTGENRALTSISFSNDGRTIVTGAADGTVQLWNAITDELIRSWQAHKAPTARTPGPATLAVAFSPDDQFIATSGNDGVVRLWSATDTGVRAEWDLGTGGIKTISFSHDGQYLVGACKDQTVRVWSIADKSALAVLRGHDQSVMSASFSPQGLLILTASKDRTARLWELGANEVLSILAWSPAELTSAAFSPDGGSILVAGNNGGVQLYSCDVCAAKTADLLHVAEARRTRQLTPPERQRFLEPK